MRASLFRQNAPWYWASFVALGLAVASLGPTLPALAERTRSHLAAASVLFAFRQVGYLVGTFTGGRAFDRVPGNRLLAAVLTAMAGALVVAPLVPLLGVVSAAIGVVGVAEGMLDVGVNTLIVWEFRERAAPRLNALHACFGFGAFLSPLVVASASSVGGVSWAYAALALAIVVLPLGLLRLPSPSPIVRNNREHRRTIDRVLLALVSGFFVIYVGSEATLGGWVYTYAIATGLGGAAVGAYLASAFWGALATGRVISIALANRVEPARLMTAGMIGGLVGAIIVLAFPRSLVALAVGTICAGASLAAVFPTTLTLAARHMPVTGWVNSWFFAGASIGGMCLPWVVGQFFDSRGPRVVFALVAVDLVASLAVLGVIELYLARRRAER